MRLLYNFWLVLFFQLLPLYGLVGLVEGAEDSAKHLIVTLDPRYSPSLQAFEAHLKEEGIAYKLLQDISKIAPEVFYGLSLELIDPADVSKLKNSLHVQGLSPVMKLKQAVAVKREVSSAPSSLPLSDYPPHLQTNITQLHKMGIFGKGIKIAVIDGAVDCTHPAFGDGFGPGFKLGYGWDFVGDEFDGHYGLKPGPIPCSSCTDHATHIAGIIAGGSASNVDVGFDAVAPSVAPNATLGIYRVFGCSGFSTDDIMMAAILRAHRDGSDVITISSGYPGGWSEGSPLLDTVNKLIELEGATIIYAAGNQGEEGLFYPETGASARSVISVGSVDSTGAAVSHLVTSTGQELIYHFERSWDEFNASYPIYVTSNSTQVTDDACNPLPSSTPNLKNYVVLIRRGTCWFSTKAKNAQAKGANKILVYMNSSEMAEMGEEPPGFRVGGISEEDGKFLYDQSRKDPNGFTVRFPPMRSTFVSSPGGKVNRWSQYGPSLDFTSPQPTLCGVGGNVLSTISVRSGSYGYMSGTSMAAPQLAGIAGLVMSVRGKEVRGLALRARLVSTAQPLIDSVDPTTHHTVAQQGGGLVNALCAVLANTSLSTFALSLNDTSNFNATQTFSISNSGKKSIKYTLSHLPSATVYTYSASNQYSRPNPTPEQDKMAAKINLSIESFLLAPGDSQTVQVVFEPPAINSKLLPVYSGFITLTTDEFCESHSLPYYGAFGSLRDQKIIDRGPTTDDYNSTFNLPHIGFKTLEETKRHTNQTGDLIWSQRENNSTFISYRTNFATPSLRLYLVPESNNTSSNETLEIPKNCAIVEQKFPRKLCKGRTLLGEIPRGVLLDGSDDEDGPQLVRSAASETWVTTWNQTLITDKDAPHQLVPKGRYHVYMRALRMAGDPMNDDMYEDWISPILSIQD